MYTYIYGIYIYRHNKSGLLCGIISFFFLPIIIYVLTKSIFIKYLLGTKPSARSQVCSKEPDLMYQRVYSLLRRHI